jgi:tetratricopeptide (TPR) repeat protein
MDFDDFQLLTEPFAEKNDTWLDDIPVDSFLYRTNSRGNPTPADVTIQWAEGYSLTEPMKEALIAILANKISIAINMDRVKEAESILIDELEKVKSNPAESAKLLITMIRLNERMYPAEAKNYYVKAKNMISVHESLLDAQTRNNWSLLKRSGDFEANPNALRVKALELLENKQYAEAENIYFEIIELDFEIPGTLCHLARVQLLMGQEEEAEKSVRKAWKIRDKALRYVVPRIIFLRILLLMIKKKDPSIWIGRMKHELQNPDSFLEWHIQPVLDLVKSRLTDKNHRVLVALAESLQYNNPGKLK